MNDPGLPRDAPAGDGELLSAYLDGDLDGAAEAEVEARLLREPELAAHLEHLREVVEALASLRASPPPGYQERLRDHIAGERAGKGSDLQVRARAGDVTRASAIAPRGATAATGPGRARGRRRWVPALSAAAGVMLLAVLGGVAVLGGLVRSGQDQMVAGEPALEDAAEEADDARLFGDSPDDPPGVPESVDDDMERPEEEEAVMAAPAPPSQPALVDEGTILGDADEAREHFERTASATGVMGIMGLDTSEAEETALAFRVAIQRADPFSTGTPPDRCLDEVTAGTTGPVVPVLVEMVTFEGRHTIAYVVSTASSGSQTIDRLEAWMVDPEACATRLFTPLVP